MIPKLIFKFDKEKDLYNLWETSNSKIHYGYDFTKKLPKNVLKICNNKKYNECKNDLKKAMKYLHESKILKITINCFEQSWKKINQEYFRRLEKITKEKFPFKEVKVYLTTAGRCPYNSNPNSPYFYMNFSWSIPVSLSAAGHELMHLQFHNSKYWKECEKEIGYTKTHDLKESLTVLLNWEFKDLWTSEDEGYPNHIKLRKFIEKKWKKEKDFNKLTDNCIRWIKKNGVK
jgi:hypothetical protein